MKDNGASTVIVKGGEEWPPPGDKWLPRRRYGFVRVISSGDAARAERVGQALAEPAEGLSAFQSLGEHGRGILAAALASRLSGGDLRYEGAHEGMLRHKLMVPATVGQPESAP